MSGRDLCSGAACKSESKLSAIELSKVTAILDSGVMVRSVLWMRDEEWCSSREYYDDFRKWSGGVVEW